MGLSTESTIKRNAKLSWEFIADSYAIDCGKKIAPRDAAYRRCIHSLLSDVQEEMGRGNIERANEMLNGAKIMLERSMPPYDR